MIIFENVKCTLTQRINYVMYGLKNISLKEAIEYIRNGYMALYDKEYGSYTLRQAIEFIREVDEKDRQSWKFRLLPAVTYNGTFIYVDAKGMDEYSRITAMDFDDILTMDESSLPWILMTY